MPACASCLFLSSCVHFHPFSQVFPTRQVVKGNVAENTYKAGLWYSVPHSSSGKPQLALGNLDVGAPHFCSVPPRPLFHTPRSGSLVYLPLATYNHGFERSQREGPTRIGISVHWRQSQLRCHGRPRGLSHGGILHINRRLPPNHPLNRIHVEKAPPDRFWGFWR